jgi:hypothetical protein
MQLTDDADLPALALTISYPERRLDAGMQPRSQRRALADLGVQTDPRDPISAG